MSWRYLRCFVVLFLAVSGVATSSSEDSGPLSVGITGSAPSDPTRNPTAMLRSPEVQRLVLSIAERPHSRAEVEAAIAGQFFTIDDMVAVGLLREEAGAYWIDFNLLRVEDQERILEVSKDLGRSLAGAFLDQRRELEAIAQGRMQPATCLPSFSMSFSAAFHSIGTAWTLPPSGAGGSAPNG